MCIFILLCALSSLLSEYTHNVEVHALLIHRVCYFYCRVWDSNTLSDKCDSTNAIGDTSIPNYPIFCAAAGAPGTTDLLIAGGSSETSFIGTLIHSVDVWPHAS